MAASIESKIEQITQYIKRMHNDMVQAEELAAKFKETIDKMTVKQSSLSAGTEERSIIDDVLAHLKGITKTLTDWISEFEVELDRVGQAERALASSDMEAVKLGFAEFVLTDTAFSVKNTAMMFYDFNEFLASYEPFLAAED